MKRHLAVVEDDEVILGNYADFLGQSGFQVDRYDTKEAALHGLFNRTPELVLLDITLNGERDAGFAVCAEIRRRIPSLPVVFLTSHDGEVDRISGLRLGADDYVTKDVSLDFLVVRIEALFRRIDVYRGPSSQDSHSAKSIASASDIEFNEITSTASWKSRHLDLTLTQFWMLKELCAVPGQPKSHRELMLAAKITVEPNTIAAHIKAIRQTFLNIDPTFERIRTERGRGYRWMAR